MRIKGCDTGGFELCAGGIDGQIDRLIACLAESSEPLPRIRFSVRLRANLNY